jgi:hypothetical protein
MHNYTNERQKGAAVVLLRDNAVVIPVFSDVSLLMIEFTLDQKV